MRQKCLADAAVEPAIAHGIHLLRRRSRRKESHRSLLLSTAVRNFPTLAAEPIVTKRPDG